MSEKERIEKIILLEGITAGEFAKEIGVQTSTISHIITERNRPSLHVMRKILKRYTNINSDWLILGQGEMMRDKTQPITPSLFSDTDAKSSELDSYPDLLQKKHESKFAPTSVKREEVVSKTAITTPPVPDSSSVIQSVHPSQEGLYPKQIQKPDKKIERIIIYFTDNTYQEFESK